MLRSLSVLRWSLPVALGLLTGAASLQAAEVSLVSGLYKSDSEQKANFDDGKQQQFEVGARFSDALDQRTWWFVTALVQLKSYDKGSLPSSPDDSTGIDVSGGLRYYFNKLGESIAPFAEGQVAFRDLHSVAYPAGGDAYDQSETNGLYYGASFGLRFNLAREFFVDLQSTLFDSALFATQKTDHVTFPGGVKTVSTDQTKRTELYASSDTGNAFGHVLLSMGLRF